LIAKRAHICLGSFTVVAKQPISPPSDSNPSLSYLQLPPELVSVLLSKPSTLVAPLTCLVQGSQIPFFSFPFCWDGGLAMLPRLALNSRSSCLSLLSAGITGVYHHARPVAFLSWKRCTSPGLASPC
jgi:hypothetical protein